MGNRQKWEDHFFIIAESMASRSTCLRRQIGAVTVDSDNRILTVGYNASASGAVHCSDFGICIRDEEGIASGEKLEVCAAVHAEQNAICQAAIKGISLNGATIYITTAPCIICSKLIINSGIKKVIYKGEYSNGAGPQLLKEVGIEVIKYEEE